MRKKRITQPNTTATGEQYDVVLSLESQLNYDISQMRVEPLVKLNDKVVIGQPVVRVFLPLKNSSEMMNDDDDEIDERFLAMKTCVSYCDGVVTSYNDGSVIASEIEKRCSGDTAQNVLIKVGVITGCAHEEIYNHMCLKCSKSVNLTSSQQQLLDQLQGKAISLIHEESSLKIRSKSAKILDQESQNSLLKNQKKLVLVLDIDHTLLHATNDGLMHRLYDRMVHTGRSPQTIHRVTSIDPITKGRYYHLIKYRPHLMQFLHQMNQLFELHIFTHGNRAYANSVKKLLDPNGKLFGERVISRTEMADQQKKDLDHIFPADDRAIIIIDDNIAVWHKHQGNVYHIVPYDFWKHHCGVQVEVNNLSGGNQNVQEREQVVRFRQFNEEQKIQKILHLEQHETDRQLIILQRLLTRVHTNFFAKYPEYIHARDLIVESKSDILQGLKIMFTGILDKNKAPESNAYWRRAQRMGAECVTDIQPDITHVVTGAGPPTEKVKLAKRMTGVFVVHFSWIDECYKQLERLNEFDFYMYSQAVTFPIHQHYDDCQDAIINFQTSAQDLMNELHSANKRRLQPQSSEMDSEEDEEESSDSDDEEEMFAMLKEQ